jgi:hypothetical protein
MIFNKLNKTYYFILLGTLLFSCREIKKVSTTGTSFGHNGGPNDCVIDKTPVSCNQMKQSFRSYKKNIRKCKPKWLIQYNYKGIKVEEGYAVRKSLFSHHHYWLAEKITYGEAGDILSHEIDSNINIQLIKFYPTFIVRRIALKDKIR